MSATPGPHGEPAIRVIMMPRDTNPAGTIFGGVLLSYIDQAAAIEVRKHTPHLAVTIAMDGVVFKEPVFVGDVVSFYAIVTHRGRTSITIHVAVEAERYAEPGNVVPVTHANLTFVTIGPDRRPIPLDSPLPSSLRNPQRCAVDPETR